MTTATTRRVSDGATADARCARVPCARMRSPIYVCVCVWCGRLIDATGHDGINIDFTPRSDRRDATDQTADSTHDSTSLPLSVSTVQRVQRQPFLHQRGRDRGGSRPHLTYAVERALRRWLNQWSSRTSEEVSPDSSSGRHDHAYMYSASSHEASRLLTASRANHARELPHPAAATP
jgi:hypothetical protein